MFSGIVSHVGQIAEIEMTPHGKRFLINTQFIDLVEGESICVDGVCLTVTGYDRGKFYCDLSPETLSMTIADDYSIGSEVNLERALLASDRIGGHWVCGHVDGTLAVVELKKLSNFWQVRFEPSDVEMLNLLVSKGSVTLNGVSLTINDVDEFGFSVMLIPHTLAVTNLKTLEIQRKINVEYDMLAKIIAKQVKNRVLNDGK